MQRRSVKTSCKAVWLSLEVLVTNTDIADRHVDHEENGIRDFWGPQYDNKVAALLALVHD